MPTSEDVRFERASHCNLKSDRKLGGLVRVDPAHREEIDDFTATTPKRVWEAPQAASVEAAWATRPMAIDELSASIAHEIKQPLAAVVTNANACLRWLANDPPNLDEAREAAKRVVRDGRRASEVIESIRSQARKGRTERAPVDVNDLVHEVLALTHHERQRHRVSVQTELSAEVPRVLGNRIQLQQVALNLIMNGIEAMTAVTGRPRLLLVRSQADESGGALIAIEDSGIGLDPRITNRIFDTFFTTKPSGMGLGLSICRSIVEAHGGRLWASPRAPHGAIIRFTLPAAPELAVAAGKAESRRVLAQSDGPGLLLDDRQSSESHRALCTSATRNPTRAGLQKEDRIMRSAICTLLAAAFATMATTSVGHAQARLSESTTYKLERIDEGDVTAIGMTGAILPPMADDLAAALNFVPLDRKVILDLDSAGGEMDERNKIIALIERERKHRHIDTLVWYGHLCASMCIPIYLQGEKRHAAALSVWMFHPAHEEDSPFPGIAATATILGDMVSYGMSREWLQRLERHDVFATPGEFWISGADLYAQGAGVITDLLPAQRRLRLPLIAFDPQIQPR